MTRNEFFNKLKIYSAAYLQGEPQVSDEEYDRLYREALALPEEDDDLNGFLKSVGGLVSNLIRSAEHTTPMLSLHTEVDSSVNGLIAWLEKVYHDLNLSPTEEISLLVELKFDGIALNLKYNCGKLYTVLTRGDGYTGEDVTQAALELCHPEIFIKMGADHPPGELEIRGELMLTYEEFHKLNAELEAQGKPTKSNPRNAIAGLVRTKDVKQLQGVRAMFVAYGIGDYSDEDDPDFKRPFVEQSDIQNFLIVLGFWRHAQHRGIAFTFSLQSLKEERAEHPIWKHVKTIEEHRLALPFMIDGVVYKVNRLQEQEKLGFRSNSPRWALAQKFEPSAAETLLSGVNFYVGRTGRVTPVAVLNSVRISGVTVEYASLHNIFDIRRRNVRIGDKVTVYRSGDVIPEIGYRPRTPRETYHPNIRIPKECPRCQSLLERSKGEIHYYCSNAKCPARVAAKLTHFVGPSGMDIKGLGPLTILKMVNAGEWRCVADIYETSTTKLSKLGGMPAKEINKLVKELERSFKKEDYRYLAGIGIPGVGMETARAICRAIPFPNLGSATFDQLIAVSGVGEHTAKEILKFLDSPDTYWDYAFPFNYWKNSNRGGPPFKSTSVVPGGRFFGKTFVISGKCKAETINLRRNIENYIRGEGGVGTLGSLKSL